MIYIQSIKQISIQEPLSSKWFEEPVLYDKNQFIDAIDPDFKPYFSPIAARRIDHLLKRAVVTAKEAVQNEDRLQGIIMGSGLGSIEMTEKFLLSMIENSEEFLQPTAFTNSTHNTICALVALTLKCHGYNTTYSHTGMSFDSALLDGVIQIKGGHLNNVLVCANDYTTPRCYTFMQKTGYLKDVVNGQVSLSMLLSDTLDNESICQIVDGEMLRSNNKSDILGAYQALLTRNGIAEEKIKATVVSASRKDDADITDINAMCLGNKPMLWYKHIFGENTCASAMGIYVAATCLQKRTIPSFLYYTGQECTEFPEYILVYNRFNNTDHSIFLLKCLN